MRTLTRRLAPHSRTAWLTFATVAVVALVVAISTVVLNDGGRMAVGATVFAWLVAVVVLAAFLDAVLVPGNPDVRRRAGHAAGWSGALGGAGWSDGGGHGGSGDGGSSCS
ncbi:MULTISPECIES: hypothetical protein [unclassified Nocardioides]|uniref:hypothetical protein n=1 Tax=unclassified Nocardioides TaxID=2615069 RepID=UPI0030156FA2